MVRPALTHTAGLSVKPDLDLEVRALLFAACRINNTDDDALNNTQPRPTLLLVGHNITQRSLPTMNAQWGGPLTSARVHKEDRTRNSARSHKPARHHEEHRKLYCRRPTGWGPAQLVLDAAAEKNTRGASNSSRQARNTSILLTQKTDCK
jgi:hypothetical protein